ncbi:MAG: hypothetical protein IPN79_07680 [Saprospiraceae bacterium]|nr:hypothetical protein [Saprospiraceae bacterium]
MKTNSIFYVLIVFFLTFHISAQENRDIETGMPGDHFSLEGALTLFQQADSPENFEKSLNTEDNHINNLDLNEDGEVDYIKVNAWTEKEVHVFVLQVAVSETENQDIATIQLEKTGKEEAQIQIIGDEEIFGEETIVEPSDEGSIKENDVRRGPNPGLSDDNYIVVNVWTWPSVRFVYTPGYRPWISPWRWRVYPKWWRPWRPMAYHVYRPFKVRYHGPKVRVVTTHRSVTARNIYSGRKVSSKTVTTRYAGARSNYKVTKTKTKVTGPAGNTKVKKSTTVTGPRGNSATKKTTKVKKSRKG